MKSNTWVVILSTAVKVLQQVLFKLNHIYVIHNNELLLSVPKCIVTVAWIIQVVDLLQYND